MKNIKNFNEFVTYCQGVADALQTNIKVNEYPQYNWAQVVFQTDNFGGDCACFHYDLLTNRVHNWFGTKDEKEICDCDQLVNVIRTSIKYMLEHRDMNKVYEHINTEY